MFQDWQNSVIPVFFTIHIFQSFQHFSAFKLHKALKYMLPNYIVSSYWGIQIWRRTIKISFQAQMVKWPDNYEAMLRVRKRGGGKTLFMPVQLTDEINNSVVSASPASSRIFYVMFPFLPEDIIIVHCRTSAARSCLGSHTEHHSTSFSTECTLSEVPFPSQYFHTCIYGKCQLI